MVKGNGEVVFNDDNFRFGDQQEWSFVGLLQQNIPDQFTYVNERRTQNGNVLPAVLRFHNRMAFHVALRLWYALTGCQAIGSLNFNNKPQSF